jgi:hypothetical protein
MESKPLEYLNLIAAYMVHALAESQSMGKLLYAFKNVRSMEKFLEENAHAPDGTLPILARETTAYVISLSISCVCEQQYLEGQGFSCLRAGYVGP